MTSLYKKLVLFWLFICSSLLYADGVNTIVSINSTSMSESNADTQKMTFTVTLSEFPILPVTIDYTTYNGSAIAGSDYVAQTGSLTFWPLETTENIEIDVLDDAIYERNEYFYVKISTSEAGYEISGTGNGYGTIMDDELPPLTLYLHDRAEAETDSNRVLQFTAQLNRAAPVGGVTINYTTADNTALAGSDYTATSGTLTIPEGQVNGYIGVETIGDLAPEGTETFKVQITSISTGSLSKGEATCTIWDDDTVKVAISSSDVMERNVGDSNVMPFRIYLAKAYPLSTPLTINYQTQDGSVPSATASSDYTPLSGSVTFNQGDIEKIVNVPIIGDDVIEPDENLKMVLSGSSYIIDADSESEILNDDGSYPGVTFTTAPFSIIEGNTSTTTLNFHFTLDKPAVAGTSFEYYTQDNEATTTDSDYVKVPVTKYVIPEGETEITIPITINGDTNIENDESFWLKIQNEVHINVSGHTAEGIILNDDGSYPSLTFNNATYTIVEGNSGQSDVNFTFTLDQPALAGSSFDYYTQDMTAQSSTNDYVAIPVTHFAIPEGETQFSIPVTINGDTAIESDENFRLILTNPNDLTFGAGNSAIATILNDDGDFPEFSIEAPILEGKEGNSGTQNVNFTIKLSEPATQDGVSVEYQTVDGTATFSDNDYQQITQKTVVFNTGESEKSFSVVINGDVKIENDELFTVQLFNPQDAKLDTTKHTLTIGILNDDEHSDDPLVCDSTMYLSSSINREDPAEKGKMWLHRIDTTKNPFDFLVMNDEGSMSFYNALAYSDVDNYIYGLYKKELVQMTKTGKVISLGEVDDLPDILTTKQLFAGAIFGDYYYVSGPGVNYDKIFVIKLPEKTVSEITLDAAISLLDFSFTPDGKYLHGIVDGGKLVKIDVATGHVVFIGAAHTGFQFDSTFSDKNGRFFANDSFGQGFYEFNLDTGEKLFLSDSEDAEFNDGANCLKAALVFNDYGDAPASYGHPRHNIANGIFMGSEVDHDINAFYSVDATGDDSNGIDDEDGVTLFDGSDLNGSYLEPGTTQQLQITLSKNGYLNAWLDYDINGVFDAGDQIINAMNIVAGTHTINVPIPTTVTLNQTTYLRFRFSSTPTLDATQNTIDGEVEDYAVQFGVPFNGVKGLFNVQRTDSAVDAKDFALYTQIVGRDFDYHVVFYDEGLNAEQSLANVPVKIDLIDEDSGAVLYTHYSYFSHTNVQSRIPIGISDDLDKLPATKRARFRISYAANADDSIVQQKCAIADFEACYNALLATSDHNGSHLSQDNFAIRPERFFVALADNDQERVNSEYNDTTLRVAAGYDYNLTLIATRHNTREPAEGYNEAFTAHFDFNLTGLTRCQSTDAIQESVTFHDGFYNNPAFDHDNVGHYTLTLVDDTNWTAVDQATGDCVLNKDYTSANDTSKSGCNIATKLHAIHLEYFPYRFAVNLTQNNLPSNSHPDFIYMSDLNNTYDNVGIQFIGDIIAQSKNGTPTSNFTQGCVAKNVDLFPEATTLTEDGFITPPSRMQTSVHSTDGTREDINVIRMAEFNDDIAGRLFTPIENIIDPLTITPDKFLDDHNGSVSVDLRYNIQKPLQRTVNPIQMTFHEMNATSHDANSTAEHLTEFVPTGSLGLDDMVRNFYFAQIAPDEVNYPRIVFGVSPIIRTPLNVDIFCDKNNRYCIDTNVTTHTDIGASARKQQGWYISIEHNTSIDGNVTGLEPDTAIVRFIPDPSPASPIGFSNGRYGILVTRFESCSDVLNRSTVFIEADPHLLYSANPAHAGRPSYTVNCVPIPPSQWTGVGEGGNIIESDTNRNSSQKIEW